MEHPSIIEETNEMAFSQENQDWIQTQIQQAIAKALKGIKPASGFRKALFVLREWGVLAVVGTVIVALLGIVATLIVAVTNRREADATFRANSENFQRQTNPRLEKIESEVHSIRLLLSASQPTIKQNQDAAKELLVEARLKSIPAIPETVVEQAGKSFLSAASEDREAWKVALDFVSYRSSLNALAMPSDKQVPVDDTSKGTFYLGRQVPGKPVPRLFRSGVGVPIESAARIEPLGSPVPQSAEVGPNWVAYLGGAVSLDLTFMRHVVLRDVEVYYSGAPVVLQDTLFINCTFVFDNSPNARKLGSEILSILTQPPISTRSCFFTNHKAVPTKPSRFAVEHLRLKRRRWARSILIRKPVSAICRAIK